MDGSSLMLVRDINIPVMSRKEEHAAQTCSARCAASLGFRLEDQAQRGREGWTGAKRPPKTHGDRLGTSTSRPFLVKLSGGAVFFAISKQ